jgi:hypothetical protein
MVIRKFFIESFIINLHVEEIKELVTKYNGKRNTTRRRCEKDTVGSA